MAERKKGTGGFYLWAFAVALVVFGLKTLWHEIEPDVTAEQIKEKIGDEQFDRMVKAILPISYGGLCIKEEGPNAAISDAATAYNKRNEAKVQALLASIKASGGLTSYEKDAFQDYVYAKIVGDVHEGRVPCRTLAERINHREWDL